MAEESTGILSTKIHMKSEGKGSFKILIIFMNVQRGEGSMVNVRFLMLFMMHCDFHVGSLKISIFKALF